MFVAIQETVRSQFSSLVFQVAVDPLFYFAAAVVGGIEADAERFGFPPGHDSADADAG